MNQAIPRCGACGRPFHNTISEQECRERNREKAKRYYHRNKDKALERNREYRRDANHRLVNALRSSLWQAFHRVKTPTSGCLTHMSYSSIEFVGHINTLIAKYHNQCPTCGGPLDNFHIEHKIPISTANTYEEIVKLFSLDNLDVLCGRCNRIKSNKMEMTK